MVEAVVVKESLTNDMTLAGAELTRQLDGTHFIVSAALWLYIPETNAWRFIIASPEARTGGLRRAYKQVQTALAKMPDSQAKISLKDITVIDSKDPLISLIRPVIKTGDGVSGIRFSQNVINGVLIEDAYIYRLT